MPFWPINALWSSGGCFGSRKNNLSSSSPSALTETSSSPPSNTQILDAVQNVPEATAAAAVTATAAATAVATAEAAATAAIATAATVEVPPTSAAELQRRAEFVQAVRAYDWDGAKALAATEQEKVDVKDSKNRVDWMEYFLAQGDSMQAMMYAITSAERQIAEPRKNTSGVATAQPDETKSARTTSLTNVFGQSVSTTAKSDGAVPEVQEAEASSQVQEAEASSQVQEAEASSQVQEAASPSKRSGSRRSTISRISSVFRRKSSKAGDAPSKESGGEEVHLQAGRL